MTEQNEPSMEDILASIRNILAEDEESNPERANNNSVVQDQPENLEQVQKLPENESGRFDSEIKQTVKTPEADLENSASSQDNDVVVNLTEDMIVSQPIETQEKETMMASQVQDDEDDFTPEPVIPQEPMKEETLTDLIKETAEHRFDADDSLLAEPTVIAATESLSHLRDIASEKRLHLGKGDMTIEAIVRETLKPYLKEWLDINLPDIVERVVKKEIAHVMDRLDLK